METEKTNHPFTYQPICVPVTSGRDDSGYRTPKKRASSLLRLGSDLRHGYADIGSHQMPTLCAPSHAVTLFVKVFISCTHIL